MQKQRWRPGRCKVGTLKLALKLMTWVRTVSLQHLHLPGTWGHGHHLTNEDTLHYLPATTISSGSMMIKFGKGSDIEATIQTNFKFLKFKCRVSSTAALSSTDLQMQRLCSEFIGGSSESVSTADKINLLQARH